jgi:hypothetical protein
MSSLAIGTIDDARVSRCTLAPRAGGDRVSPGVAAWGAVAGRPWAPQGAAARVPGAARDATSEDARPSARERMFHRNRRQVVGAFHRRFIGCDVASAHRCMIASAANAVHTAPEQLAAIRFAVKQPQP